jgi:hypothetical protein
METALHIVVSHTEMAVEHKIALGAFLDIEGVLDQTSFEATASTDRRFGVEPLL